ncbi:DUF2087 domain-containing protein [Abyssisolibacter fermentans]|uniref:DUF2087 domain-containing protein n=1 Tax=Abyssisolibacter fermentans TaxID=1766203 RepID=UPI000831C122|nr:DUF2087 domain-containing protein [Abyssisolibacter fermentans]
MAKFKNFLDKDGKVKAWPAKYNLKIKVLEYIADKFECDRFYSEKEVNEIINQWHSFGDYLMIRRGMIDYQLLARTNDGKKYWKVKHEEIDK